MSQRKMNPTYSSLMTCIANHGAIEKTRALGIFTKIHNAVHETNNRRKLEELDEAISVINQAISPYDQKIREHKYTLPGAEGTYLAFITTTESSLDKIQPNWNAAEVELFRLMLRDIVTSEDSCRTMIHCMNLTGEVQVKSITKASAEAVIQKWINLGYFYELNENIYLGPRLIAEFSTNLRIWYKDFVAVCNICRDLVFWGPRCGSCDEIFHKDCIEKYLQRIEQCPTCKELFQAPT